MIAGRRARKKPLVRTATTTAVVAGTVVAVNGKVTRYPGQGNVEQDLTVIPQPQAQDAQISFPDAPPQGSAPLALAASMPDSERMEHLQQLIALHESGILTDEEFSTAKQRLIGE